MECRSEMGRPVIVLICGTLVYYHCAYRDASLVSLLSDVLIVLLCSLAILGLLFRQINISVPVDPLEWQISQDTANSIVACLANTIGAAESVLRVAATGHDKRLFLKVVLCLYVLSALGRVVSGLTVAYAGLCLLCLYMLGENSQSVSAPLSRFRRRSNGPNAENAVEDDAI
ncbi:Reticulon [Parasponia andersonii]|uniref:Reticulon n=1 Tax=Parasponia andersonii TaxID=3476 RepID=A0A2P5DZ22_PARAD|nr:Reticulon [Parasponia andersonii]